MPPKGKKRGPPQPRHTNPEFARKRKRGGASPSDEPSRWSWMLTDVKPSDQINDKHCLWACGFVEESGKPVCRNKYAGGGKEMDEEVVENVIDLTGECSVKGCKDNPNCLNYLGQDKWENEDEARKLFLKHAKLGPNPLKLLRDPETPVGLRNLGATCYANAFLQVWFQDLAFRAGVYACEPSSVHPKKLEDAPLFQLQATFAALQECRQSVFNPSKLVESLELRATEQQDAQEFSKLFMSHLAREFGKQDVPSLKSLVADQFEGKLAYCTLCKGCGQVSERESDFLELELNLAARSKLEERIEALLKKEELSGDNQYRCSRCDKLQDASRYTKLKRLPPVLHFSLLRFVFDYDTLSRKKSKQAIRFPVTIDMSRYVDQSEEAQDGRKAEEEVYELRGVLLHKGPSAYHGHYEAQVFDVTRGRWFQFNDESVTPIDSLMDGVVEEDASSEKKENQTLGKRKGSPSASKREVGPNKRKRMQAIVMSDDDIEIDDEPKAGKEPEVKPTAAVAEESRYITSKDAYMLIYARRGTPMASDIAEPAPSESSTAGPSATPGSDIPLNVPHPPASAIKEVDRINDEHDQECLAYDERRKAAIDAFEQIRKVKRGIYQSWNIQDHNEDSVVVNAGDLEGWLSQGIVGPPKPSDVPVKAKEENARDTTPTQPVATEEGLATPTQPPPTEGPFATPLEANPPSESDPSDDRGKTPVNVETGPSTPRNGPEGPSAGDVDGEHGHSDADSARTLVSSPPPFADPIRSHLQGKIGVSSLCEHGLISPPASNLKRISKAAHQLLISCGVEIEPVLVHTQVCSACTERRLTERLYILLHPEHTDRFSDLNSRHSSEGYWVSKSWLRDWRLAKPKMHVFGQPDPAPDSTLWRDDVLCEHSGLKLNTKERIEISADAYYFLRTIFPDWQTFATSDDCCFVCTEIDEMSLQDREQSKKAAEKEKIKLKSLFSSNPLGGRPELVDGFAFAIIPSNFLRDWRRWILDSAKSSRPEIVETEQFFCRHGKLIFDPNEAVDLSDTSMVAIKLAEWKVLAELYSAGPLIRIESGTLYGDNVARNLITCNIEVCQDCRRDRKSTFTHTEITIHVLHDSDALPIGEKYSSRKEQPIVDDESQIASSPASSRTLHLSPLKASDFKKPQPSLESFGYSGGSLTVRKSKRLRQPKEKGQKTSLPISKEDTVKDMKVNIADKLGIATIYQRLFYNGVELSENKATVEELGILANDTVQLVEEKPDGAHFDSDVDVENDRPKKKKREEGRAFGGTLLAGGDIDMSDPPAAHHRGSSAEPSVSRPDELSNAAVASDAIEVDDDPIACPTCTFLNPVGVSCCTLCDQPFSLPS